MNGEKMNGGLQEDKKALGYSNLWEQFKDVRRMAKKFSVA